MKTKKQLKGQVTVFLLLMFQVLFVFFAMIINIGLIVHAKINVQSAADLAAYYGAMKQAELLNVIGHVNYQIRQSWKLFNFRYRVMGMSNSQDGIIPISYMPPYHPVGNSDNLDEDYTIAYAGNIPQQAAIQSGFCIATSRFDLFPPSAGTNTENYCKQVLGLQFPNIPLLQFAGTPMFPQAGAITAAMAAANAQVINGSMQVGAFNYFMLSLFSFSWSQDVKNRRKLVYLLADNLSKSAEDFVDIEGDSVRDGVRATFIKNLGQYDKVGDPELKYQNSLGTGPCAQITNGLPAWLNEIPVYPSLRFMDSNSNSGSGSFYLEMFPGNPNQSAVPYALVSPNSTSAVINLAQQGRALSDFVYPTSVDNNYPNMKGPYILGFEKNPWCVPYFGVSAKVNVKMAFMPFSGMSVEVKASAFAKGFGGSIGPWYSKSWPSGQSKSVNPVNQQQKIDMLSPVRFDFNNPDFSPENTMVKFSRYIGDKVGSISKISLYYWMKAFKTYDHFGAPVPTTLSLSYWKHLANIYSSTATSSADPNGDALAWDNVNNQAPSIRYLEAAFIAPDQFDLTYYPILSNFSEFYLPKLKTMIPKLQDGTNFFVRGDLGARAVDVGMGSCNNQNFQWNLFSSKNQIACQQFVLTKVANDPNRLSYYTSKPGQLLSWYIDTGPILGPRNFDTTRFMKCLEPQTSFLVPNNCLVGGRTGYSVKNVNPELLSLTNLGLGASGEQGPALNPPNLPL